MKQVAAIEQATGLPVDGIVINPANALTIQLAKDANGQYLANTPLNRPLAVSNVIAVGMALVGAFATGGQLFQKGGIRVEASNSHSDYFVKNLVAVRAELRAALAVYRPSAFGLVTGLN